MLGEHAECTIHRLTFAKHHIRWGDRLNYDESLNMVKHENMMFLEILDPMIWRVCEFIEI